MSAVMAAITFGSVGDIIALCELVRDAVTAFSQARGSAAVYRELATELNNLSLAMYGIQRLLKKNEGVLGPGGTLNKLLGDCENSMSRFLRRIAKFEILGSKAPRKPLMAALRKVQWLTYQV